MATGPDTALLPPAPSLTRSWQRQSIVESSEEERRAEIAALYTAQATSIQRFLTDLLGDGALAADATQETFVRAFRRLASLEDRAQVAPWLFGIARNVARELRKARARAGKAFAPEPATRQVEGQTATSPEGALLDQEAARIVSDALGRLGEDRRAALLLRLDHSLSYDQIAQAMGWSLAKVKVEIFRAREQLRLALLDYEGGAR